MRRYLNKKAQSTVEYLLVLAAIVGVIIWAAGTPIKTAVGQFFTDSKTAISEAADKLPGGASTAPEEPAPPEEPPV